MAFTVTARHSGTSGATAVQTQATNSTTPTASSLLLAFASVERDLHTVAESWSFTGGGTWTSVANAPSSQWTGTPDFNVTAALQRLTVGASPSPHTITADAWSGVEDGYYSVIACDITGHNTSSPIVQFKTGGATEGGGDSESLAVTFDSALTTGNLVVANFGAGNDVAGAFTSPTIGGQTMTQLHNLTGNFCHAGMWYRILDGTETDRTVTCSDLGQSVGASAAVLVEIAIASSGSNFTQTPTDNLGVTDSITADQTRGLSGDVLGLSDVSVALARDAQTSNSLGLTDSVSVSTGTTQTPSNTEGLTDAVALARTQAPADAEGLTDSAALVAGWAQTPTDSLGLTDSAQVGLSGSGAINSTDSLGLTDSPQIDLGKTQAETLGLTDSIGLMVDQAIAESLGLTDSTSVQLSSAGAINPTDQLGLSDSQRFDLAAVSLDTESLTDAVIAALSVPLTFTDPLGLTDSADVSLNATNDWVRTPADVLGLTDSVVFKRITIRPNTGITTRPYAGTTARP